MKKITINNNDQFIYNNEIRPYLPEHIFDAHSHILKTEFHDYKDNSDPFYYDIDMNDLQESWRILFPDSRINGLVMGMPVYNCDLERENEFVAASIKDDKNRFSIMTKPQMSLENLESAIKTMKPNGLKPYLVHALIDDKQNARITDFITEEQVELADKYHLTVTLHVSKPRGMADNENLEDISRLVKEYPNCQFILAHCGRCFIAPNMKDALDSLPDAENLWIDTSAVCDTGVFLELFSRYDTSRILFGSDLVNATAFRGSYVRLGLSWHAVTSEMIKRVNDFVESKTTFAVYENLSALFQAAKHTNTNEESINKIFYENASKLFKL